MNDPKAWRIGKDGRVHRKRHKVFPNGDVYDCEFVRNKPDGIGTLVQATGIKYEGSFSNGLFHGPGTITREQTEEDGSKRTITVFKGVFRNGKKHGFGILYDNGDRWEGNFKDDVFQGKGYIWRANGERQRGDFVNGKLHCEDGLIVFESGDKYEGPVYLGTLHGDVGHYSFAKGRGFYTGQHRLR